MTPDRDEEKAEKIIRDLPLFVDEYGDVKASDERAAAEAIAAALRGARRAGAEEMRGRAAANVERLPDWMDSGQSIRSRAAAAIRALPTDPEDRAKAQGGTT